MTEGILAECKICGTELLNPHEITGLCRECKLVLRNERMSTAVNSSDESIGTIHQSTDNEGTSA